MLYAATRYYGFSLSYLIVTTKIHNVILDGDLLTKTPIPPSTLILHKNGDLNARRSLRSEEVLRIVYMDLLVILVIPSTDKGSYEIPHRHQILSGNFQSMQLNY